MGGVDARSSNLPQEDSASSIEPLGMKVFRGTVLAVGAAKYLASVVKRLHNTHAHMLFASVWSDVAFTMSINHVTSAHGLRSSKSQESGIQVLLHAPLCKQVEVHPTTGGA